MPPPWLWKLAPDGSAVPVPEERLAAEAMIESAVESAPELLGIGALIIGRQIPTPSGPLDLLPIDSDGRLVVVETSAIGLHARFSHRRSTTRPMSQP